MINTNKNNEIMDTMFYEVSSVPTLNNDLIIMITKYNINNPPHLNNKLSRT